MNTALIDVGSLFLPSLYTSPSHFFSVLPILFLPLLHFILAFLIFSSMFYEEIVETVSKQHEQKVKNMSDRDRRAAAAEARFATLQGTPLLYYNII